MRLLLLLSALLTALVGVGTPAAAVVRPACEVSATATVRTECQAPRIAVATPRKLGALNSVNLGTFVLRETPARTTPLYAQRLRV